MVSSRNYSLVIGAGVAVLLFTLVGAATITGVLPTSLSRHCKTCGVVAEVKAVEVKGNSSGVGAVAGGVTGAVIGNQFGRGDGNTLMTIAGAAGGALAGNEIEKQVKKQTVYRVTVRMDDGSERTLSLAAAPAFAVGARVRVNGQALERG